MFWTLCFCVNLKVNLQSLSSLHLAGGCIPISSDGVSLPLGSSSRLAYSPVTEKGSLAPASPLLPGTISLLFRQKKESVMRPPQFSFLLTESISKHSQDFGDT